MTRTAVASGEPLEPTHPFTVIPSSTVTSATQAHFTGEIHTVGVGQASPVADPDQDTDDLDLPPNHFSCGCGFTATTADHDVILELMAEHARENCPNRPAKRQPRWYEHVSGFWTAVIVGVIAYAVVVIVEMVR